MMENLRLIPPSADYADAILDFKRELASAGDADAFAGCSFLEDCATVAEWLVLLKQRESPDTCPAGTVPSDAYLAVRISDNRIVGMIDLRRHIQHPVLGLWGGHMGYSVRPSERGKGYAREMLHRNLQNARARGIDRVLLTCSRNNPASRKTIVACGGVFEKEILVDGECIQRYWITL
ncbi:MAG: GNAT family N-acetyltransferase [Eubacteriales bacterium]